MSESKRKIFTGRKKPRLPWKRWVRGMKTINEIAQEHGVHPTQVSQWKKELLDNAGSLFEGKRRPKPVNAQNDPDRLRQDRATEYWSWTGLKKVWGQPVEACQTWVTADDAMPSSQQCQLLKVTRSMGYEQKKRLLKAVDEDECLLLLLLDEEYMRHPFHGSRRMTEYLCG